MPQLSPNVTIPDNEIEMSAVRAQGAGGQNVNKVSTAVHLRFDIKASSLPQCYKEKLFLLHDQRITKDGVIIIKAQNFRVYESNREEALERLVKLIKNAVAIQKKRNPTKPSRGSQKKRLEKKIKRGTIKTLRQKVAVDCV